MAKRRKKNVDLEIWSDFFKSVITRFLEVVWQAVLYVGTKLWKLLKKPIFKLTGGCIIYGYTKSGKLVFDYPSNRNGHTAIKGKTGFGKSSLAVNLAIQNIEQGTRILVIDPHGNPEAVEKGISAEIYRRVDDTSKLTFLSVNQKQKVIGYNPLFLISNFDALDERKDELMNSCFFDSKTRGINSGYQVANRAEFVLDSVIYFHNAYFDWLLFHKNKSPSFIKTFLESHQITINDLATFEDNPALIDLFIKILGFEGSKYHRPDLVNKWQQIREKTALDIGLRGVIGRFRKMVNGTESKLFFESFGFDLIEELLKNNSVLCDLSNLDDFTIEIISKLILIKIFKLHKKATLKTQTEMYIDEASIVEIDNLPQIITEGRKYKLALSLIYHFNKQFRNPRIIQAIVNTIVTKINFRSKETDFNVPSEKIANLRKREFMMENSRGVYEAVYTFPMPDIQRKLELNEVGEYKEVLRERIRLKRNNIFNYFTAIN